MHAPATCTCKNRAIAVLHFKEGNKCHIEGMLMKKLKPLLFLVRFIETISKNKKMLLLSVLRAVLRIKLANEWKSISCGNSDKVLGILYV